MDKYKKKLLFLIKIPPPITGATIMNHYLSNSKLLKEYFDIQIIGINYSNNTQEMGKMNCRKLLIFCKSWFRLLVLLMISRPEAVYFQISPLGIAFLRDCLYVILIKAFSVKTIYHLHGKGIYEQAKINWKKFLYMYVFKNSYIICLSDKLTFDIDCVFKGRKYIVNNGIPDIDESFLKLSLKNRMPQILFLSNLSFSKGIIDYIDSLYLLMQKGIPFNAFIVGAEKTISEKNLQELLLNKNLSGKVTYISSKYGTEKNIILAQSDVLVLPTKNDAFPLVILEAMQFGLPIISTREGAIPEIIKDGVNGFLVDKDSPLQIAEKLEILINNDELRKQMGTANRKRYLENYTFEKFEINIKKVFEDVICKKSKCYL